MLQNRRMNRLSFSEVRKKTLIRYSNFSPNFRLPTNHFSEDSSPSTTSHADSPSKPALGGGLDFTKHEIQAEEVIGRQVVSDDSEPEAHHSTTTNWTSLSKGAVPQSHGLLSNDKEADSVVAEEGPTEAQVREKRRENVFRWKKFDRLYELRWRIIGFSWSG